MGRQNGEDQKQYELNIEMGLRLAPMILAVTAATMTLDRDSPTSLVLDPDEALTLTLPAVERGLTFFLWHKSTGAFDITVSSPVDRAGAAGATTMGTVSQNEAAMIYSDGVTWFVGVLKQT